jgi:hypothetical protein
MAFEMSFFAASGLHGLAAHQQLQHDQADL